MGWHDEVEARIAELEHYRLMLEEARKSARSVTGPEGARLEARIKAAIKDLSKQINDLRASLE
jgi:hypothetical protein